MNFRQALVPVAITLAMGSFKDIVAAEPVSLNKESYNNLKQSFNLTDGTGKQSDYNLRNSPNALKFMSVRTDHNKVVHKRMQQYYLNYPVIGGYAILHADTKSPNRNFKMTGLVYKNVQFDLGVKPQGYDERAKLAFDHFKKPYVNEQLSEGTYQGVVYIDKNGKAHWAYQVSVFVEYQNKIPERPTEIVDAVSYQSYEKWNDVKTVFSNVKGLGFGGNLKMNKYQFGAERPHLAITRDDTQAKCFMENVFVKVIDMQHKYSNRSNRAMSFKCGEPLEEGAYWTGAKLDGYDEQNGAFSPSNDALYAGNVIYQMYKEWYKVDVLTSHNRPLQLVMRVHYGNGYENAFWDGKRMTFGDGDTMMYPLVSLGVGAHEISHGFTEQHSNLSYYGQSGGMNESFSDMAAQVAESYAMKKSSWLIGAEIMKQEKDALRFMDKPSKDGSSIDYATDYQDGLDVHYSSGVYNRLFYLLAHRRGWNVQKAFSVMLKANMDYWTPYTDFATGACGVLSAAKDLNYSLKDIKAALDGVKINYTEC